MFQYHTDFRIFLYFIIKFYNIEDLVSALWAKALGTITGSQIIVLFLPQSNYPYLKQIRQLMGNALSTVVRG